MESNKPTLNEIEKFFKDEVQNKLPIVHFTKTIFNCLQCEENEFDNYLLDEDVIFSDFEYKQPEPKITFDFELGESLFKKKAEEGWDFNIKLVSEKMMFEGTASFLDKNKIATGKTLDDLFSNLFGDEERKLMFQK